MPPRGINIQVVTVPDLDHATDQTIAKFISNALHPTWPRYREDIDAEISKLKLIQDRIKTQRDYNKVSNPQAKAKTSTIIDSVLEDLEDTPLDHQIKRAHSIEEIPGTKGTKHLGRIWGAANK